MSGRKSRDFSQMQHCASPAQSMRQDGLRAKCRFLRFARNLRPHCFGEGKRVEHFSDFFGFYSAFETARIGFG